MKRTRHHLGLGLLIAALAAPAASASLWDRLLGVLTNDGETTSEDEGAAAPILETGQIDFAGALREAPRVGSERVVERLGRSGGFSEDPALHIALPATLERTRPLLAGVGLDGYLDDLELRLNRAAETATPRAKDRFIEAIQAMTIDDARRIVDGEDDAATAYLRSRMASPLTEDLRPIVDETLREVGALRLLDSALARYRELPFAPPLELDLGAHVTERTIDGIFLRLADEERAIRADPARRTTDLLRAAFDRVARGAD